jgi:hypothetical protein
MLGKLFNLQLGATCVNVETHSNSAEFLNFLLFIISPLWLYRCQLWGTASISNIERNQRFQSKFLRITVNALWLVPNWVIQQDFQIPSVKEEIKNFSEKYHLRLSAHPNQVATDLLKSHCVKILKMFNPSGVINRFNSHWSSRKLQSNALLS